MTEMNYDYWYAALAGEKPPIHEGDPQCGYYKKKNKNKADSPVAVFVNDGKIVALVGTAIESELIEADKYWTWFGDKPVSYEDYKAAYEDAAWEKAVEGLTPKEPAPVGHNNPPEDPFESFKEQIANAATIADKVMAEDIKTKEQADRLANSRERLLQLFKESEEARKAEKKPHDDAATAVQIKWKPIVDQAKSTADKARARIDTYIKAEEQRLAKEALERAKEAEKKGEEIPIEKTEPVRVGGGVSGRRTSAKTVVTAIIEDRIAFATFLLTGDNPNGDVMDALQRAANKIVQDKGKAPGIKVKSERKAT